MNRLLLLVALILTSIYSTYAQGGWKNLGCAEKVWVVLHPFSVGKANKLTKLAIEKSDSIQTVHQFKNPKSGGRLDAFRHVYWMSLISSEIGPKRAAWLGNAHEKKGRKDFEKKRLEDGNLSDKATYEMDVFNNLFGVKVGKHCYKCSQSDLLNISLQALKTGELRMIKMNKENQSLNKTDEVIPKSDWEGIWENDRVLINSSF